MSVIWGKTSQMWKGIWSGHPEGEIYLKYKRASGFWTDIRQEKGLSDKKVKAE